LAIASPIPLEPPVTNIVLPARESDMVNGSDKKQRKRNPKCQKPAPPQPIRTKINTAAYKTSPASKMASLDENELGETIIKETMDEMVTRHKKELKDMQYTNRQRLKVRNFGLLPQSSLANYESFNLSFLALF
jgi:hypothetical protein